MREIKFKAYIKNENLMVYIEMFEINSFFGWNDKKTIIMQYTGLKDKNGVEIYEGDIMQSDNGYFIGVVEFNKGVFILSQGKDALGRNKFDVLNTILDFEIIGNIYENSNLLGDNIEQN